MSAGEFEETGVKTFCIVESRSRPIECDPGMRTGVYVYSIWVGTEKGFMHLSILQMKRRGVLDPRPDNCVNGVSCYHPRRCPITPQLCVGTGVSEWTRAVLAIKGRAMPALIDSGRQSVTTALTLRKHLKSSALAFEDALPPYRGLGCSPR